MSKINYLHTYAAIYIDMHNHRIRVELLSVRCASRAGFPSSMLETCIKRQGRSLSEMPADLCLDPIYFGVAIRVLYHKHLRMQSYSYHPLETSRSFRILKLLKDELCHPSIRCKLVEAMVGSHPHYEAISYSWDRQKPTQLIFCEGRQLWVTKNCEAA